MNPATRIWRAEAAVAGPVVTVIAVGLMALSGYFLWSTVQLAAPPATSAPRPAFAIGVVTASCEPWEVDGVPVVRLSAMLVEIEMIRGAPIPPKLVRLELRTPSERMLYFPGESATLPQRFAYIADTVPALDRELPQTLQIFLDDDDPDVLGGQTFTLTAAADAAHPAGSRTMQLHDCPSGGAVIL